MKLLSEITINASGENAVIQLLQGDLAALPKEHNVDLLIISAFPNDYTPLPGSLMHALKEKGMDVSALAKDKMVDLTKQLGCWLSKPLSQSQQEQFNFKHILCFEPSHEAGSPESAVGNIFRCINNFAFDDDNNAVAMPVLASGKQKIPIEKMLPALLDASIFWMESGIPLNAVKLVLYRDEQAQVALPLFNAVRQQYEGKQSLEQMDINRIDTIKKSAKNTDTLTGGGDTNLFDELKKLTGKKPGAVPKPFAPPSRAKGAASEPEMPSPAAPPAMSAAEAKTDVYDYFISYSHVHTPQVTELVNALKSKNDQLNIFYDRSSIPAGGLWIRMISDAIQKSKYVVCVLSPQYRNSDVCWDEFQCAKAKEYKTKTSIIKTINFLKDDEMPLIMSLYSYIDCTEGDVQKLKEAVDSLL